MSLSPCRSVMCAATLVGRSYSWGRKGDTVLLQSDTSVMFLRAGSAASTKMRGSVIVGVIWCPNWQEAVMLSTPYRCALGRWRFCGVDGCVYKRDDLMSCGCGCGFRFAMLPNRLGQIALARCRDSRLRFCRSNNALLVAHRVFT
jgi:hypothetical protein